jgi:hypothetical protein
MSFQKADNRKMDNYFFKTKKPVLTGTGFCFFLKWNQDLRVLVSILLNQNLRVLIFEFHQGLRALVFFLNCQGLQALALFLFFNQELRVLV